MGIPALGPAVALGGETVGEIAQPMSEQERLQKCNEEIVAVLDKYGCELRGMPQSRVEGNIILIDAVPRLTIKQR